MKMNPPLKNANKIEYRRFRHMVEYGTGKYSGKIRWVAVWQKMDKFERAKRKPRGSCDGDSIKEEEHR